MKLKKIGLKNFRILKDCEFELSPLTIIVGPNSSGKSSLFKALLLLKQNLKKNGLSYLEFDQTAKHGLGSFSSIINDSSNKTVSFSLVFEDVSFHDSRLSNFWSKLKGFGISYAFSQEKGNDALKSPVNISNEVQRGELTKISLHAAEQVILALEKQEDGISVVVNLDLILSLFTNKSGDELLWDNIYIDEDAISNLLSKEDLDEKLRQDDEAINQKTKKEINALEESFYKAKSFNEDEPINSYIRSDRKLKEEMQRIDDNIARVKAKINSFEKSSIELKEEEIDPLIEELEFYEKEKDELLTRVNKIKNDDKFDEESEVIEVAEEDLNEVAVTGGASDVKNVRKYFIDKIVNAVNAYIINELGEIAYQADGDENSFWRVNLQGDSRNILDILNPTVINDKWGLRSAIQEKVPNEIDIFNETNFFEVVLNNGDWNTHEIKILRASYNNSLISHFVRIEEFDNIFYKEIINKINPLVERLRSEIPFTHFSATRGTQQRIFNYTNENNELEEAIAELHRANVQNGNEEQISFLRDQLQSFQIGTDIKVNLIDGSSYQVNVISEQGNKHALADLGFGITQLIPILIKTSLKINTDRLVGIEEPGTNLHPHLQSNLASFYLSAIASKTNFLVETHSEYFLRKLQALVAEHPSYGAKVKVLYMKDGNIDDEIYINDQGDLINSGNDLAYVFPSGFYDVNERVIQEKEVNRKLHYLNKELQSALKNSGFPLLITEGKTDWKHIKRALKKFNEVEGRYLDLVEFVQFEENVGDKRLDRILEDRRKVKIPNMRKIIFVFDRDNESIVNKREGEEQAFRYYGNNIYSFCIPKPDSVDFENLSIEHYYAERSIKLKGKNGRRLFLAKEFSIENGLLIEKPELGVTYKKIHKKIDPNKVIDNDVKNIDGDSFALSKSDFAEYIYNEVPPFDEVGYENFSLIFDVVEQIKAHYPEDV